MSPGSSKTKLAGKKVVESANMPKGEIKNSSNVTEGNSGLCWTTKPGSKDSEPPKKKMKLSVDLVVHVDGNEEFATGAKVKSLKVNVGSSPPESLNQKTTQQLKAAANKKCSLSTCAKRIQIEIARFYNDPPPGIFIAPDDADITNMYSLVIGPEGTPYEGGFFYFHLKFPSNYPLSPPQVQFLTTSQGRVRFNPNFYKCGKVCLSILGTWNGPSWTPSLGFSAVLISIQSLMNENPYHNEPGYEIERKKGDVKNYNDCITHETIRVAVCEMLEGETADTFNVPKTLKLEMVREFSKYYDHYMKTVEEKISTGPKYMQNPFSNFCKPGVFDYTSLKQRLTALALKHPNEAID